MAKTYNPLGLGGCLLAANGQTGTRYQDWRAAKDKPLQRRALALNPTAAEIEKIPELERWASKDHGTLNRILEERNFDSRFEPFTKDRFGALSILDVTFSWLKAGDADEIEDRATGKKYPGFRLSGRGCGATVIDGSSPVARVETQEGDVIFIQKVSAAPKDDIAVAEAAAKLIKSVGKKTGAKGILRAPLISFHETRELDWVIGLSVPDKVEMEKGFQETRFGMNHLGARAKVATGGGFYATAVQRPEPPPVTFVLDGPAIIVAARRYVVGPIFAAYVTPEDWKDPGELGAM